MNIQRNVQIAGAHPANPQIGGEPPYLDIDINEILGIARARWKVILGTAATITVLTGIALFQLTPLYSATALVMLDQRRSNVVDVEAVLAGLPTDPSSIENQVQILQSRGLSERVIDKLNLASDPEFNPALIDSGPNFTYWLNPLHWLPNTTELVLSEEEIAARTREGIVNRLINRLSVQTRGRSTAIAISVRSENAAKASILTNAVADAYVEDQLNAKFDATQKASQWLSDRLSQLSVEVQASSAAIERYKAENNLIDTVNGGSIVEQQLTDLNGQLILARSTLAEQEAKYAQVTEMQLSGRSADVTSVVASPLIGQLRQEEAQLLREEAESSSRYGARHPRMLDIQSQKKNLREKITEEVNRVTQTAANEVGVTRARVRSLQASLSALQNQTSEQNQARIRLRELEASASSSRSLYDAFLARFGETQGQEGIEAPDSRVISRAVAPGSAAFPNKRLALGVAVPGGLVLGFLLALMIERLDSGFRTTDQVEKLLGLPVLATVPELEGRHRSTGMVTDWIVDKPLSAFAESMRGLQMGLVLSNVDNRPKVVLVTSAVPGEGKTTVAVSLARLAARSGQKVVLVDSDLRRPTVASTMGVRKLATGIIDTLSGRTALDRALLKDPRSAACFLPVERKALNPSDLLSSASMEKLIANLRSSCDLVIIDSAPLLPVNDTRAIANLVDAIVVVARWEKTARDAVVGALRKLSDIDAPVAGIVLTRADTRRFHRYSYGSQNYASYTKYYND